MKTLPDKRRNIPGQGSGLEKIMAMQFARGFKVPLFLTTLLFLVACESGYEKRCLRAPLYNGKVMTVHDKWSFQILDKQFARDNKRGYFRGTPIKDSHGASFRALGGGYAVDARRGYYGTTRRPGTSYYMRKVSVLRTLDVDTKEFRVLDSVYARDNRRVFVNGRTIAGAHAASFQAIKESYGYGRDRESAYRRGSRIAGSHGPSFRVLGESYAKDRRKVYHEGKPLADADSSSFTLLRRGMARDDKHVYYRGEIWSGVDAASFRTFENSRYAADKTQVLYAGKKIPGARPEGFRLLTGRSDYAMDGSRVYYRGKPVQDAEVKTFRMMGTSNYSRDANRVYYRGKVIEGVDLVSFEVVSGSRTRARDRNRRYHSGRPRPK